MPGLDSLAGILEGGKRNQSPAKGRSYGLVKSGASPAPSVSCDSASPCEVTLGVAIKKTVGTAHLTLCHFMETIPL